VAYAWGHWAFQPEKKKQKNKKQMGRADKPGEKTALR
jgi:hypothetical protein